MLFSLKYIYTDYLFLCGGCIYNIIFVCSYVAQIDIIYRTRGGLVANGVREPRRQEAVR